MIGRLRLVTVIAILLPVTVFLLPVQMLAVYFDVNLARSLPVFWHRLVAGLIGLRVKTRGKIESDRPLMLVSNHLSWMDIVAFSSVAPVCFIAKREVAQIPFAGMLARLQRSVFVTREDRRGSARQVEEIASRLQQGDVMVLFAEGTTGMGDYVLPFKSSLFGATQTAARDGNLIKVQPVSIAYTHTQGTMNSRRERVRATWPGTIELLPHTALMIKQGATDAEISFGKAIEVTEESKRKHVAAMTHETVFQMYHQSLFPRHRDADPNMFGTGSNLPGK